MKPIIGFYGIQDRNDRGYPVETHDHAICRVEGGCVVQHMALERWTRSKHDNRMALYFEDLLEFVLRPGEEPILASVDSFAGRAFISRRGRVRVEASPFEPLSENLIRARAHCLGREVEAWVVPHELAHLGSSLPFMGHWEDNTLLVHYDGAASQSCCSAWLWRDDRLSLLHAGWDIFPAVSEYGTNELAMAMLGHSWQNFLAVPGKLMGLAPYGNPEPEVRRWLDLHEWFVRLPGGPQTFVETAAAELRWTGELTPADPLVRTIAACFQQRFEQAVFSFVARFAESTRARNLVLSGGGALNLQTNQMLADNLSFANVFAPPCASDDGLALGAASLLHYLQRGPLEIHSPFLNNLGTPTHSEQPLARAISVADAIAAGKIVGTCIGAAEVGPRALGHRSLLVRPTLNDVRRLSVECKQREPWRPVAPLILAELADRYFEGNPSQSHLARYMLGRHAAKELARVAVPGVVHTDGTARLQVVDEQPELRPLRQVLMALFERHQIPCVVNTSFNARGEPIVQTYEQAMEVARRMRIDLLWHDGGLETPAA
jgi:carbamoyltransferase